MNKIHLFVGIVMIQSFLVESKDYTFLPQLKNETSERCSEVEAARFISGDLELACDDLEKVLSMKNGSYENISNIDYLRLPFAGKEMRILKPQFRLILSDQDVATQYREYREFKALAGNLALKNTIRKQEEKIEYKKRRAEEKLTKF